MGESILKNSEHQTNLFDIQKSIFDSGQFVDCLICCSGSEFRVHRSVLANASDFFQRIITEHPAHAEPLTIVLSPDFDAGIIFNLLELIYLGQTQLTSLTMTRFQETCEILQIKNMIPITSLGSDTNQSTESERLILLEIPNAEELPDMDESKEGILVEDQVEEDTEIMGHEMHYYEEDDQPDQIVDADDHHANVIVMSENQEMNLKYMELDPSIHESIVQDDGESADDGTEEEEIVEPTPKVQRLSPPTVQHQTQDHVNLPKALKAMLQRGLSLNEAANMYGVPRQLLLTRYKKLLHTHHEYHQSPAIVKSEAVRAIEQGNTVKKVFEKYTMPLRDVVKMKQRMTQPQNTTPQMKERPTSSANIRTIKNTGATVKKVPSTDMSALQKLHVRANEYKVQLQRAINSCKNGMGLQEASAMYSIPAATLYRNIKHMKLAHIRQP